MDSPRDFFQDLNESKTPAKVKLAAKILSRLIPGATVAPSADNEDKLGADAWLETYSRLGVDIKYRTRDCRQFSFDDICLEVETNGRPGWALEPSPLTSMFVWIWLDSERFYVCDALSLSCVTQKKLSEWKQKYTKKASYTKTRSGQYKTECVYPPLRELDIALALWRRGEL